MDKDDDEQAEASSSFPDVLITEKDRGSVHRPHDDPVVIECKVFRVFLPCHVAQSEGDTCQPQIGPKWTNPCLTRVIPEIKGKRRPSGPNPEKAGIRRSPPMIRVQ